MAVFFFFGSIFVGSVTPHGDGPKTTCRLVFIRCPPTRPPSHSPIYSHHSLFMYGKHSHISCCHPPLPLPSPSHPTPPHIQSSISTGFLTPCDHITPNGNMPHTLSHHASPRNRWAQVLWLAPEKSGPDPHLIVFYLKMSLSRIESITRKICDPILLIPGQL